MAFIIFLSFFIAQRLSELAIARRNEGWLQAQGAVEYGQTHYPFIVLLHASFILSMIGEYSWRGGQSLDVVFLILFLALIAAKAWVIASLGKYWNTKIFRVAGAPTVRRGLYKYVRHPNYIIVVCEFIVVPMVFHLYITAVVFSILNAAMLRIRIREENKVWEKET